MSDLDYWVRRIGNIGNRPDVREIVLGLKQAEANLLAENRRLRDALKEAENLIRHGVEIMSTRQIGMWDGVRAWQEAWEENVN